MTRILHLMSTTGGVARLSRIAARVLAALQRADLGSHAAVRNVAENSPGGTDEEAGMPARACQLDEAQRDATLVPEPRDTGGVHALVSF